MMDNADVARLLESRRAQLKVLQLETQLVEQEARRLRGITSSPATSAASTQQQIAATREPRSSLHAPSAAGSVLSLHDSRGSTPLPAAALSPRPASNASRRGSRRSSSSGDRNTGRLPRGIVQELLERAIQETQRQLEALRLQDSAEQRQLHMRVEAITSQTKTVHIALDELKRLEQRKPVTQETLNRWEVGQWIAGTEREIRRLRLQLGRTKLREKRAINETSEADLQLLQVHTQRRKEEIAQLFSLLLQSNDVSDNCSRDVVIKMEENVMCLKREVSDWHTRTAEKRGLLLSLHKRNQRIARQAIALEEGTANINLQIVTEYACLRGREEALKQELRAWERRQALLKSQIRKCERRRKLEEEQAAKERAPAPHSSPAGSSSRGEGREHPTEASEMVCTQLSASSRHSTQTTLTSSSSNYLPDD